jgi:hypothetical protein
LKHDKQWGIATMRQRVLVCFDMLAHTTEEFGYLEAIGASFHIIAVKLHDHWLTESNEMPYDPAFR